MYDYDCCLIYTPQHAEFATQLIAYAAAVERLKLVGFEWNTEHPPDSIPATLDHLLQRSAVCAVCLNHTAPWDNPVLKEELLERVQQRLLRLVHLFFAEPVAYESNVTTIRWGFEAGFKQLSAVIVGEQLAHSSYTSEFMAGAVLGSAMFGTFLPPADYVQRPEDEHIRAFWQADSDYGVLGLIGIGGSGKTCLLLNFLQAVPDHPLAVPERVQAEQLKKPGGIFGWSFYDNPQIEELIRSLYTYLTGEATTAAARELTYKLLQQLETRPVPRLLLVFDGLEKVQEDQKSPAGFGSLRDSSLRHLVRRIARGDLPIKLLITSRYPLYELEPFMRHGYWTLDTNMFDQQSAIRLFNAHGLDVSPAATSSLLNRFGNHALTLDHVARLINTYFAADVHALDHIQRSAATDQQADLLAQVLNIYTQQLTPAELAVLQVIALIRKPLSFELLASMFTTYEGLQIGETIWPTDQPTLQATLATLQQLHSRVELLASMFATYESLQVGQASWTIDQATLQAILATLQQLHLISVYEQGSTQICTTHQSIRDYFSQVDTPTTKTIHQKRIQLLTASFSKLPAQEGENLTALITLFTELIYHSLQVENPTQALMWYTTLGYQALAWRNGDYQRGLALTHMLVEALGHHHVDSIQALAHEHNLFLLDLGYAARVEQRTNELLRYYRELTHEATTDILESFGYFDPQSAYVMYEVILLQTLADAKLAQGKLQEVVAIIDQILAQEPDWQRRRKGQTGSNPYGRRAIAHALSGNADQALIDFKAADEFAQQHWRADIFRTPDWHHKPFHAQLLARLGRLSAARTRLRSIDIDHMRSYRPLSSAWYDLAAAEIAYVAGEQQLASTHSATALAWALQSGHQQIYAQAHIQRARLYLQAQQLDQAEQALVEALSTARSGDFNIQLVDALVLSGYLALANADLQQADQAAHEASSLSQQLDYRWGLGDATYLLAKTHQRAARRQSAQAYAEQSLALRRALRDPRVRYSQQLLEQLQ